MKRPTNQQIENYYNSGQEDDVQYCKFKDIPKSLVKEIYNILKQRNYDIKND